MVDVAPFAADLSNGAPVAIGGLDAQIDATADWNQGFERLAGLGAVGFLAGLRRIDAGKAVVIVCPALRTLRVSPSLTVR